MTSMGKRLRDDAELRKRAETIALAEEQASANLAVLSPEEIRKKFHELRVQLIQLEIQNEELLQFQLDLDASRMRYFDLFDLAPAGCLTLSDKGLIQEANLTAVTLLGLPHGMLINKPFAQFIFQEDMNIYHLHCQQNLEADEPKVCELRMVKQEGTPFWVHLTVTTMPQSDDHVEYCVVMSDIVDRKRAEDALRRSEEQINMLFSHPNVGFAYADPVTGHLLRVNDVFCRMTGYSEQELLQHTFFEVTHPEDRRKDIADLNALAAGKIASFQSAKRYLRPDGSITWVCVTVNLVHDAAGRPLHTMAVIQDITQLKRAERALQAANTDLERRVEQRTLELQETQTQYLHAEKLSAIGQLSASFAHEFNNPLQGIISVLKGLKRRAIFAQEDKELLDAALGESYRMKDLIRSLQDFNRPTSGNKTAMDVHESLDSILLLYNYDLNSRRIWVRRNYEEPLPFISAVPDQIKQVLLNLLTNAADACHKAGGEITITTRQEKDKVAVAIKDNGVGIKPEEMEHIFKPFFTTKSEVKGSGLGLSVSYGIVKKHHGEIRVESQPGEDAVFTVVLPINSEAEVNSPCS